MNRAMFSPSLSQHVAVPLTISPAHTKAATPMKRAAAFVLQRNPREEINAPSSPISGVSVAQPGITICVPVSADQGCNPGDYLAWLIY